VLTKTKLGAFFMILYQLYFNGTCS